jgi:regulator of protease activity HflC (stomatin/prohibitin superfamily)
MSSYTTRPAARKTVAGTATAVGAGILAVGLLTAGVSSYSPVDAGHVAVVTRFGEVRPATLQPGLHWVTPFIDQVHSMDARVQIVEVQTDAATRDLQDVSVDVALNFRIEADQAAHLYQTVGRDFQQVIVMPALQESLKAVTATFTAEGLLNQRPAVSSAIVEKLNDVLGPYGIRTTALNITNLSFSPEFMAAIEAAQVANQQVVEATQRYERARIEAQQRVMQAEAEAEAMALLNQELTPEYLNRLWIERWNGQMPQVTAGDSSGFMFQVPESATTPTPVAPAPTQ